MARSFFSDASLRTAKFSDVSPFLKGSDLPNIDAASARLPAELCREALDAICDAIVAVGADGEIDSYNAGFLRLTGGDCSPASLRRLFPAGCRPLEFYDGLRGQTLRQCTLTAPWGAVRARVAYTRSADCVLASVHAIDETAPEREPPPWVLAVLEAADSVIVLLDGEGIIRRINRAAQLLLGYSPDEVVGRLFWETMLFEEDVPAVRAELDGLLAGESSVARCETRWRMKDGSARVFSCSSTAARGSDGRVEYVVATALDLTAERRHQSALASLSSDFMEAQSAGRRNVSSFLHDTVSQYLVVLALTLSKLQREPDAADPFEVAPTLDLVDRCCRDLRVISYALAPPVFEDSEPAAAFEWYVNHLRQDAGVNVEFHCGAHVGHISPEIRKLLLAAVQEWAEKTIRSEMVGKTQIRLTAIDSGVRLELSSDQPDNEAVKAVAASRVIRERVRVLGGSLEVEPRQPGVSVSIVIASAA